MNGYKFVITIKDSLRLLIFFSLYFYPADSQEDYYRTHPSSVPIFLKLPHNITVHEGELAKLRCHIENLGPKVVLWRKFGEVSPLVVDKKVFAPDHRLEIEYEKISKNVTRWDLIIKDVTKSYAGVYECQVSSTNIYTKNVTLNVVDPVEYKPEITINGTKYVSLMDKIEMTCNATGALQAFDEVDWFFNGEMMLESDARWYRRYTEFNHIPVPGRSLISTIIIERATLKDDGNYVCRATSRLADGMKVHVLNDSVDPRKYPKRGIKNTQVDPFVQQKSCVMSCLKNDQEMDHPSVYEDDTVSRGHEGDTVSRDINVESDSRHVECIMGCVKNTGGATDTEEEEKQRESCVMNCFKLYKDSNDKGYDTEGGALKAEGSRHNGCDSLRHGLFIYVLIALRTMSLVVK